MQVFDRLKSMSSFEIEESGTSTCGVCGRIYTYNQSAFCPHFYKPYLKAELYSHKDTNLKDRRGGHPRFYELVDEITNLHNRKNTDYASGTKEGPLGNFHRVSEIKKLYPGFDWDSPFGVAMGYMLKQLDAAFALRSQKRESVTGEPVRERLKDVAVYSLIGMIIEEEEKSGKN